MVTPFFSVVFSPSTSTSDSIVISVDVSRSSRSLRSRSRRKSNGATVGNTTQLAVAHVLGEKQWNLLRGMSTTVGQTIENVEECCNRIRESSGATRRKEQTKEQTCQCLCSESSSNLHEKKTMAQEAIVDLSYKIPK